MGFLKSLISLFTDDTTKVAEATTLRKTQAADTKKTTEILIRPNPIANHQSHAYVTQYEDDSITDGFTFCATMQLRTPLAVLEHHNEIFTGKQGMPPIYGTSADGIWIPRVKTWRELGIDLGEMDTSTMASAIGQIPEDGGDYLPFLKDVRRAIEKDESIKNRIDALRLVMREKKYAKFVKRHQGQNQIINDIFPLVLYAMPGVSSNIALALRESKITTVRQLRKKSDQDLLAIKGVGPSALKKIREFSENYCGDDTLDRIDCCNDGRLTGKV